VLFRSQNNKTDQVSGQQSNTQQNMPQQNLGQFKASDDVLNYLSDKKENDDSNCLYIAYTSGCVIFNKDSTGIVASVSIVDMQLVDHFISDQDKPVKQAMIEVYIVEVSTDWKRQIQSKINQGNNKFATGVVGSFTNTGGLSMQAILGNNVNIASFISLLESNALGRSISNPLILVKDGKTGVVNKVREIKQILTNPATSGGNTLIPATQQVNTVDAPLNLEITANINKHNDNIQLKFVFKETTFDDDTNFVSPSTKNEINSELIAQPGEVIVMAGLLKEKNNKSYTGLPGLSSLGLNSLYGSFVSLLGGSQTQTNSGSELLVFINPTVITNKNIGKTINRANY
jgi:type II secretory pathway component GspD/PulD (secretin)